MSQPQYSAAQTTTIGPFPAFPASGRYVELGSTGDALNRLFRAIDAREALSLVVGPPGVGKSLLCELIADGHQDSHDVVMINQAPLEHKESLIKHLLHGLGVKPDPSTDLHLQLVDRVCSSFSRSGLLIVVDEAQSLATEVLEAIRMVTNITSQGQRRVMAVLCGSPKMDDRLADPSLEALVQRVATRCYLHPLSDGQTRTYIRQTIANCGSDPDQTIDDAAIEAIHLATGGVPRLVNHMMTEAIDCAAKADQGMIDADMVNIAWANLQQLPSPMVEEAKIGPMLQGMPVEFGTLSDMDAGESSCFEPSECGESVCCQDQAAMADDQCEVAAAACSIEEAELEVEPEPEPEPIAQAPSADELFGDFSDEESIQIGVPITAATPSLPELHVEQTDHVLQLENELHDEVIAIGQETHRQANVGQHEIEDVFGSESVYGSQSIDCHAESCGSGDWQASGDEAMPCESMIEDEPTLRLSDHEPQAELAVEPEADAPQMMTPETSAPQSPPPAYSDHVSEDDSDILVVEDSIELSIESPEDYSPESSGEPLSVDFQQMMNRMRAGA